MQKKNLYLKEFSTSFWHCMYLISPNNIFLITVLLLLPQGPEFDEEEESEFTVTELKERARKQREELERRMMGDGSDEDDDKEEEDSEQDSSKAQRKQSNEDSGCSWGMGEPLCCFQAAAW